MFLLAVIYNISKLKLMHFGPCYLGSKGLQQAKIKTRRWGKLPRSSGSSKSWKMGKVSFSFLLDLLKNSEQLKSNVPKYTLKMFWVTMLVTEEKKLSKKLLKGANLVLQKGTKESKLSLGSWLVVWEANEICTFLAEFKSLKNEKRNYLMSKL